MDDADGAPTPMDTSADGPVISAEGEEMVHVTFSVVGTDFRRAALKVEVEGQDPQVYSRSLLLSWAQKEVRRQQPQRACIAVYLLYVLGVMMLKRVDEMLKPSHHFEGATFVEFEGKSTTAMLTNLFNRLVIIAMEDVGHAPDLAILALKLCKEYDQNVRKGDDNSLLMDTAIGKEKMLETEAAEKASRATWLDKLMQLTKELASNKTTRMMSWLRAKKENPKHSLSEFKPLPAYGRLIVQAIEDANLKLASNMLASAARLMKDHAAKVKVAKKNGEPRPPLASFFKAVVNQLKEPVAGNYMHGELVQLIKWFYKRKCGSGNMTGDDSLIVYYTVYHLCDHDMTMYEQAFDKLPDAVVPTLGDVRDVAVPWYANDQHTGKFKKGSPVADYYFAEHTSRCVNVWLPPELGMRNRVMHWYLRYLQQKGMSQEDIDKILLRDPLRIADPPAEMPDLAAFKAKVAKVQKAKQKGKGKKRAREEDEPAATSATTAPVVGRPTKKPRLEPVAYKPVQHTTKNPGKSPACEFKPTKHLGMYKGTKAPAFLGSKAGSDRQIFAKFVRGKPAERKVNVSYVLACFDTLRKFGMPAPFSASAMLWVDYQWLDTQDDIVQRQLDSWKEFTEKATLCIVTSVIPNLRTLTVKDLKSNSQLVAQLVYQLLVRHTLNTTDSCLANLQTDGVRVYSYDWNYREVQSKPTPFFTPKFSKAIVEICKAYIASNLATLKKFHKTLVDSKPFQGLTFKGEEYVTKPFPNDLV